MFIASRLNQTLQSERCREWGIADPAFMHMDLNIIMHIQQNQILWEHNTWNHSLQEQNT